MMIKTKPCSMSSTPRPLRMAQSPVRARSLQTLTAGCGQSSPSYLELDHPLTLVYERENSGHGTYVQDDKVYASVAGTLERVNKLVTVKPLRTRSAAAAATTSRDDLTEFSFIMGADTEPN